MVGDYNNKRVIAENIKRYMEKKGVTNQQLCDDLDFKYTTFVDWIKARTYPRIGKVEAMANYFGCEKSDLIEEKGDGPENGRQSPERQLLNRIIEELPDEKVNQLLRLIQAFQEDGQ